MHNELIRIGPITIYGYGLMIAIGILTGYLVLEYRAKKIQCGDKIFSLTMWSVLGGVVGAKLLYLITQAKAIIYNPKLLLNLSDGFVVYGGIIGGIIAGFLFCRVYKLKFFQYFDLVVPSVALAQGFGRIGCFLAGCCYGVETASPIGIVFHNSDSAPNGVPLLPTQLMASGLDFIHFFVLVYISRKIKIDGIVAGFYLIFYSLGRFILEFYRGDLIRGSVGGISTSQFISIFLFLLGLVVLVTRRNISKKAELV